MFSQSEVLDFQSLFQGAKEFYGITYVGEYNPEKDKTESTSQTVHEPVSPSLIQKHLNGDISIGISPLKGDDTVSFGAIDIDDYEGNILNVVEAIYYYQLPICPCYSKSKHLHCYFFFEVGTPAQEAIAIMRWYAAAFGCRKKVEVFPKQNKRSSSNKAYSWINLPYFNCNSETEHRKMLNETNVCVDLDTFLQRAKSARFSIQQHKEVIESLSFHDAPPCILTGVMLGDIGKGGRNNFLFSTAVFLRLKDENCDLEYELSRINERLHDSLSDQELRQTVLSSMQKETYFYLCASMDRCDKAACMKLDYGVGSKQSSGLSYGQLTQYRTDPPSYEWIVNGQKMKFSSEQELMGQEKFRQLCMRELHIVPRRLDDSKWSRILTKASENVIVVVPQEERGDFSIGSIFTENVISFFNDKRRASNFSQVSLGRIYEDNGYYIYTANSILSYLQDVKNFKGFSNMEIRARLEDMGAEKWGSLWRIPVAKIPKNEDKKLIDLGDMSTGEGESNDF